MSDQDDEPSVVTLDVHANNSVHSKSMLEDQDENLADDESEINS